MTTIEYFGHSCFRITADNGYRIVLDPYADGSVPGLHLPRNIDAEQVICSHQHNDHNAKSLIHLTHSDLDNPFAIHQLIVPHDDAQGAKRGMSAITILEGDGHKLIHYGDLGRDLLQNEIPVLQNADAIMIPCGGFFTIDSHQAYRIIQQTAPRLAILMHLRKGSMGYDVLEDISQVEKNIPSIQILDENPLKLNGQSGIVLLNPIQ